MGAFAKKITSAIETCSDPSEADEYIGCAGDLFSKHLMPDFVSGVYQGVDAEQVSVEEAKALKKALIQYLERHPTAPNSGSVFWALGKLRDSSLKEFFNANLEGALRGMLKQNGNLFQLLIALDNLGEPVREDNNLSLLDIAKNVRRARSYLETHGIIISS